MPDDGQEVAVEVQVSPNGASEEDDVPPLGVLKRPALGAEGQQSGRGRKVRFMPVVIAGGAGTGAAVSLQRATGTATSAHVTIQNLTLDVPLVYSAFFIPVLAALGWQYWRSR